jgi:hypothetical protein
MPTYHFECTRDASVKVPGVSCAAGIISGQISASSAKEAWDFILPALVIPGEWDCKLSVMAGGFIARRLRPHRFLVEVRPARTNTKAKGKETSRRVDNVKQ